MTRTAATSASVRLGSSEPKRRPHTRIERSLRDRGYALVAGVDEVGRGCLFGPVTAAAVILDPRRPVRGLNDSKQLDAERRRTLSERIRERAVAVSVAAVDSAQIDRVNIYQASRWAMKAAVMGLTPAAQAIVVDALSLDVDLPQRSIIRGDATSSSVAAASIVAKVERDRWMEEWDRVFPEYGLASNKGYGSPDHLAALDKYGPTPLHRMTFAPVAERCCFGLVGDLQLALPFLSPHRGADTFPART
ncbi:MAG TPA: ribonuclease HII [Bryobacterales bacterium]|nr:ribonuclease HII [Bryobacterales bacterium]